MKFELYTDAALACDVPEHRLRRGDLVKLVEHHVAPNGTEGYSIEGLQCFGEITLSRLCRIRLGTAPPAESFVPGCSSGVTQVHLPRELQEWAAFTARANC